MNSGDIPGTYPHSKPAAPSSPLIVVSNRGPFEHYRDEDGALARRSAGGGVAVALSSMMSHHDLTWIVGAVTDADRDLVSLGMDEFSLDNGHRLRFVGAPPPSYDLFYRVFCNPVLWFLQHSLWHLLDGRPNLRAGHRRTPGRTAICPSTAPSPMPSSTRSTERKRRRSRHAARLSSLRGAAVHPRPLPERVAPALHAHSLARP